MSLEERIEKAVTPHAHTPYEEQLKLKQEKARKAIIDLGDDLQELNPKLTNFIDFQKVKTGGLICPLDDVVPSPVIDHYRNKCEFNIGKTNGKIAVGFAIGSEKTNKITIGPVNHLRHINEQMKKAVLYLEEYLQTSPHEPYNSSNQTGVWRQMAVRTTNTGDFIIIIDIHPRTFSREELDAIKDGVLQFLKEKKNVDENFKPTAIYFQEKGQLVSGQKVILEQAYGSTNYIEEKILSNTFRASPHSFLQVNTAACEKLYEKIGELAEVDSRTAVLDICCGVGTIGISIAKNAPQLSGVDFTEGAIEHARYNALDHNDCSKLKNKEESSEESHIPLRRFYHGKAEDYISILLRENKQYNTVAILNPPRAGIGTHVINSMRINNNLNKVIYVSCDANQARGNFRSLMRARSKRIRGEGFIPVRVIPVDMFPHTMHLELIILFERYDDDKWNKIMRGNSLPNVQDSSNLLQEKEEHEVEKEIKNTLDRKRPAATTDQTEKRLCNPVNTMESNAPVDNL